LDAITEAALSGLTDALAVLVPDAADPNLQPILQLFPRRVVPTGIGGLAGVQADPAGDILGRRVEAEVRITVKAHDEAALGPAVDSTTRALFATDRAILNGHGILHLALDRVGKVAVSGRGADQLASRELSFQILYEFLKHPETAGGVITDLPLEMDLPPAGSRVRLLFNRGFDAASLDGFEMVDDPGVTRSAPSQWEFDPERSALVQRSGIRGGVLTPTVNKAGTYLVLRSTAAQPPVRDCIYQVRLSSGDIDGIGILFRWLDVNNFYYLLLSARHQYRLMGRKVGGAFGFLESPALVEGIGYETDTPYELKLTVQGSGYRAELDGEPILEGGDSALAGPGRVGFMCHGNNRAYFYRMKLIELL
jgi:hypothetical protein